MRKVMLCTLALILLFGCGKKENLYIVGGPFRHEDDEGEKSGGTDVGLLCDPILNTITVSVNGKMLDSPGTFGFDYSYWFHDTVIPSPNSEHKLEVSTDIGDADATCNVPGDFSITSPVDSAQVGALTISWSIASEAEWYLIDIYFIDTYDNEQDTTLYTTETSVNLPAAWLYATGHLDIEVYAGDGPKIESGSGGNISGAKGYWFGTNCRYASVTVGAPASPRSSMPKAKDQSEVIKMYLEEIAPYDEEAAEILELME